MVSDAEMDFHNHQQRHEDTVCTAEKKNALQHSQQTEQERLPWWKLARPIRARRRTSLADDLASSPQVTSSVDRLFVLDNIASAAEVDEERRLSSMSLSDQWNCSKSNHQRTHVAFDSVQETEAPSSDDRSVHRGRNNVADSCGNRSSCRHENASFASNGFASSDKFALNSSGNIINISSSSSSSSIISSSDSPEIAAGLRRQPLLELIAGQNQGKRLRAACGESVSETPTAIALDTSSIGSACSDVYMNGREEARVWETTAVDRDSGLKENRPRISHTTSWGESGGVGELNTTVMSQALVNDGSVDDENVLTFEREEIDKEAKEGQGSSPSLRCDEGMDGERGDLLRETAVFHLCSDPDFGRADASSVPMQTDDDGPSSVVYDILAVDRGCGYCDTSVVPFPLDDEEVVTVEFMRAVCAGQGEFLARRGFAAGLVAHFLEETNSEFRVLQGGASRGMNDDQLEEAALRLEEAFVPAVKQLKMQASMDVVLDSLFEGQDDAGQFVVRFEVTISRCHPEDLETSPVHALRECAPAIRDAVREEGVAAQKTHEVVFVGRPMWELVPPVLDFAGRK